jgi:hypothetical protein
MTALFLREINSDGFFLANELEIVLCKWRICSMPTPTHCIHIAKRDRDNDIKREGGQGQINMYFSRKNKSIRLKN